MPSVSQKQKAFFQKVHDYQTDKRSADETSAAVKKVAGSISEKDATDFANSLAETKKKVVSILKDIQEPMYLQETDEDQNSIDPVANTFHVKEEWSKYIKPYIGQPLSVKEKEAISNYKEKQPSTINRTEIWYNTTDDMKVSHTTVIKKMRDSGQFSFTAFQKQEVPQKDNNENGEESSGSSNLFGSPQTNSPNVGGNNDEVEKNNQEKKKDDIIVTKSILFKDDIKGAAILLSFLKKLDL